MFVISRFASVERTDRGEYVCEASNNVGPPVNMTAKLIVRWEAFLKYITHIIATFLGSGLKWGLCGPEWCRRWAMTWCCSARSRASPPPPSTGPSGTSSSRTRTGSGSHISTPARPRPEQPWRFVYSVIYTDRQTWCCEKLQNIGKDWPFISPCLSSKQISKVDFIFFALSSGYRIFLFRFPDLKRRTWGITNVSPTTPMGSIRQQWSWTRREYPFPRRPMEAQSTRHTPLCPWWLVSSLLWSPW